MHGKSDRYGGIEMRTRDAAGGINAEHHGNAPADVDGEYRPVSVLAQHRLGHYADAKCNQDERAEEFRRGFPRCAFEHARDSISKGDSPFRYLLFVLRYLFLTRIRIKCCHGKSSITRSI